jgi:hypothetical protein
MPTKKPYSQVYRVGQARIHRELKSGDTQQIKKDDTMCNSFDSPITQVKHTKGTYSRTNFISSACANVDLCRKKKLKKGNPKNTPKKHNTHSQLNNPTPPTNTQELKRIYNAEKGKFSGSIGDSRSVNSFYGGAGNQTPQQPFREKGR